MFGPTYLHFLDRELRDAVHLRPARTEFAKWINTLLLCTPEYLYCGASPVWETPEIGRFILPLVEAGHLHLLSAHRSLDDFIASRQISYRHDTARYPLYFANNIGVYEQLAPTHPKLHSATDALRVQLAAWAAERTTHLLSQNELAAERDAKSLVGHHLSTISHEAVTFSFFRSALDTFGVRSLPASLLQRQISDLYTRHYIAEDGGDIPTGIPGLTHFDICAATFPFRDIPLLTQIAHSLGLWECLCTSTNREHFIQYRGLSAHRLMCDRLRLFLAGLVGIWKDTVRSNSGATPGLFDTMGRGHIVYDYGAFRPVGRARETMTAAALRILRNVPQVRPAPMESMLLEAGVALSRAITHGRAIPSFQYGLEQMEQTLHITESIVLLVVATPIERDAVIRSIFGDNPAHLPYRYHGDHSYLELGIHGGCALLLAQSEAGSSGVGGSQFTVYDSIKALHPSAVVMIGIAFGLKPQSQALGDILVSKHVHAYEQQRVEDHPNGDLRITPRGDRVPSTGRLLDRCRAGEASWKGKSVRFGLIVSGEKLVDSRKFVASLKAIEPEAIGGEMEGSGLMVSALKEKTDWIIIKAICDWGMDKNTPTKDDDQKLAASSAVAFALHVINQGGLAFGIRK